MADKRYIIGERALREIREAVQWVRRASGGYRFPYLWKGPPKPQRTRNPTGGFYMFRARITGHNPTSRAHGWARLGGSATIGDTLDYADDGRVSGSDYQPGIQGTTTNRSAYDPLGKLWPTNAIVWLRGFKDDNDAQVFEIVCGAYPGDTFAVAMSQTGGTNGNKTAKASYTYDVTSLDASITFATAFNLDGDQSDFVRFPLGTVSAATKGLGYYDIDGAFRLSWCNEQKSVTGCS